MTDQFDLKNYKQAKVIVPHLKSIINLINLAIKGLEYYKAFVSVNRILQVMYEEKRTLENAERKYSKIVQNRGKVNN